LKYRYRINSSKQLSADGNNAPESSVDRKERHMSNG
jgi:hypothetical protein